MAVEVRVRATVTGQRRRSVQEHDLALALPPGPVTARQVIESAVRAEVAAYEERAGEAQFIRVLTDRDLADDLARGSVRLGDAGRPQPVDPDRAVEAALLAFDDGIFKVFAGDDEIGPDGAVEIKEGAQMLFLRLMPLAGG